MRVDTCHASYRQLSFRRPTQRLQVRYCCLITRYHHRNEEPRHINENRHCLSVAVPRLSLAKADASSGARARNAAAIRADEPATFDAITELIMIIRDAQR